MRLLGRVNNAPITWGVHYSTAIRRRIIKKDILVINILANTSD